MPFVTFISLTPTLNCARPKFNGKRRKTGKETAGSRVDRGAVGGEGYCSVMVMLKVPM